MFTSVDIFCGYSEMYVRSSLIIGLALLGVICLPSAQSEDESTNEELPLSEIKQLIQQVSQLQQYL